jgi:hydrogenase-4 component F
MGVLIALWAALVLPILGALLALPLRRPRSILRAGLGVALASCAVDVYLAVDAWRAGSVTAAGGWLYLDALSALHLGLLALVCGSSTLFALVYLGDEVRRNHLSARQARVFASLWCTALAAMTLLLVSNNLGLMWVGMETTTMATAFLIAIHVSRESLEAMWKYVLICSVGVGFAFMGTLLVAAAATSSLSPGSSLLWTNLVASAGLLDPRLMRAAVVFLLVGYGTKAGLAPMHNWLPDAHSQAPAPVSALFSGFMLNAALYCILRVLRIADAVPLCRGWSQSLLLGFGLLSLVIGAAFVMFQRDAKRLLAYCSVEHMGLIAIGFGLGGLGTFAALFHSLNHALAKTLAFFSVGRLGQSCGSHSIADMSGSVRVSPLWAAGLLAGMLALMGAAPSACFISELQILQAAFHRASAVAFVVLLLALAVAFVGMLRHALRLAWGRSARSTEEGEAPRRPYSSIERLLVAVPLALLIGLGLWLPAPLAHLIGAAANIVDGPRHASVVMIEQRDRPANASAEAKPRRADDGPAVLVRRASVAPGEVHP